MDLGLAGAGAGAGEALQRLFMQHLYEQQLAQHAQEIQQRQQEINQKDRELADARNATNATRLQNANLRTVEAIPSDTDVTAPQVQSLGEAALGRFKPLNTLASTQISAGTTLPGESSAAPATGVQATNAPSQATGLFRKLPSDAELERKSRDEATAAQNKFTNSLNLRKVSDAEGNAAGKSDLDWFKALAALNKAANARKPSFQEVDQVSNMNSAEVQAVKVLQELKKSGLDQSNDPLDPRWNTFLAQTLKIRPQDEGKADSIQRTQYVKAILGRAIMGGRPSQYVMQMIEQHLPDSHMSGKQLTGVIKDVLDELGTKRANMQNFYGPDEASKMEPVGGESYAQWLKSQAAIQSPGNDSSGFKITRH